MRRSISAPMDASSSPRSDGEANGSGGASRVKVGKSCRDAPDGLKPARSNSISARQSKLDVNIAAFTRPGESAAAEKERALAERLWTSSRRAVGSGRQVTWAARRPRRDPPTRSTRRRVSRDTARGLVAPHTAGPVRPFRPKSSSGLGFSMRLSSNAGIPIRVAQRRVLSQIRRVGQRLAPDQGLQIANGNREMLRQLWVVAFHRAVLGDPSFKHIFEADKPVAE